MSRIEALGRDRLERTGAVRLGITAEPSGVSLSVLARASGGADPAAVLEQEVELLRGRLGEWCWGRDRQTLAEVVVAGLAAAGATVSCAESCTGGLGAAMSVN